MKKQHAQYSSQETASIGEFVDGLQGAAQSGGTFDSAAAAEFVSGVQNGSGTEVPGIVRSIMDDVGSENEAAIVKAIMDGVSAYETQHGVQPTADILHWALHQGFGTTRDARRKYSLDDASSGAHDPISLQPNRAVVAIVSAIAEAIPVAHYLPADIGSNEAKLVIVNHLAGSTFGGYAADALMDGVASGSRYITSSRIDNATNNSGTWEGKVTKIQLTDDSCDPAAGDLKTLRGRANVYVNGMVAGREVDASGSAANSPISGSVVIGSTTHTVSGHIVVDTGVYALTFSPALPGSAVVHVEAFIDYERTPELTPIINTAAKTFVLLANPWRVTTHQTIDSRTQFSNELGLDPAAEAMLAVRMQFANERHYDVLNKALRLGANNADTFDFDWAGQKADKNRAEIWQDFSSVLGRVSQKMAEDTVDHGLTHLYVSKNVLAQFQGMPSNLFEPSGITARPGIYRAGRLFGQYEVYYAPKVARDVSASSSKIIGIGRSSQVARNPFVMGDAVAPTITPLAFGQDMRYGAGFYARNFTSVNPHAASAMGCSVIDVTNL